MKVFIQYMLLMFAFGWYLGGVRGQPSLFAILLLLSMLVFLMFVDGLLPWWLHRRLASRMLKLCQTKGFELICIKGGYGVTHIIQTAPEKRPQWTFCNQAELDMEFYPAAPDTLVMKMCPHCVEGLDKRERATKKTNTASDEEDN